MNGEPERIFIRHKDTAEPLYATAGAASVREAAEMAAKNGVSLRAAEIRGEDLREADLRSARLPYADLRDTDLRSATLRNAQFVDPDGLAKNTPAVKKGRKR